VQLDHVPAARPRVQPIHVLGYEGELGDSALALGQRPVARVRLGLCHECAPPLVPLLHKARIPGERLRCRELLRVVALPEPGLGLAEGRDPALGRDSGAGQRDDAPGVAEGFDQTPRKVQAACGTQPATARSSSFAPSATETVRSSPVFMSRTVQVPRPSSSSPRMAA
jgi:hypothetical protein